MHLSLRPQHLNRYRELAVLLARHGRGDLVRSVGLESTLDASALDPDIATSATDEQRAEELAAQLERLGPTFVKLGQLLSSRADLLPPAYVAALARLQDRCEPFPFADVEQVVQAELGVRLSRVFVDFEDKPIAAASLGQVHRAQLRDGRTVAVKVQRPGIREQMADDLEILGELTEFFDAHSKHAKRYALNDAFEQFRRALIAELDYRREASNLQALQKVLQDRPRLLVPSPYDDFTTSRVLTMEYVEGRKITDIGPLARLEVDLAPLADELFGAYLEQFLVAGLFHADPHPGNLLVTPDDRLALIDVGMVGRIGPDMRKLLAKLMIAVMSGRIDDVVRVARMLGTAQDDFDATQLHSSVSDLMATVAESPLAEVDVGKAMMELSRRSADAGLRPAPELALLGKTLLNLERVAAALDPAFEPLDALRRHLPDLMRSEMGNPVGGALASVLEAKEFVEELPGRVNRAMDAVASGQFELRLQAFDETQFLKGLHRLGNVAAAGLILAALIVGSALLAGPRNPANAVTNSIALTVFLLAAAVSLALLTFMALSSRKVRARRRN
jgi:predicted unusual protein kinase regulating ubiquinone biosynthesis (AarF/ABC1/UbiB family)